MLSGKRVVIIVKLIISAAIRKAADLQGVNIRSADKGVVACKTRKPLNFGYIIQVEALGASLDELQQFLKLYLSSVICVTETLIGRDMILVPSIYNPTVYKTINLSISHLIFIVCYIGLVRFCSIFN